MSIPNLVPTADDMAKYGNLSNTDLAKLFVELVDKSQTWVNYWPKMTPIVIETGLKSQVDNLMAQASKWSGHVNDIMNQVKLTMGISSPSTAVGFIPLIPLAGTAYTWIAGALATMAIATALRYAMIAIIGTITAWIMSNMALEAARKKKLADIEAKRAQVLAKAKAAAQIATDLVGEGFSKDDAARIAGQYSTEVDKADSTGIIADIGNLVKLGILGVVAWKVAEKTGVI